MAVELQEPYRARPIRCIEVWETGGWRMKVYGIAYEGPLPPPQLVEAAKQIAARELPQPAGGNGGYGVGFVGAHQGRAGCYVFVDWWANDNELFHRAYSGPGPLELEPVGSADAMACAWDLAVIAFEREAWLEAVLKNPTGPDVERYLVARLNENV